MKILKIILVIIIVSIIALYVLLPFSNSYQRDGELDLPGLESPVTVVRDGKGMAYIRAANLRDAIMAQGFVAAQDRLFQMELTRLFSQGRLTELAGEKAIPTDTRMRTIGFYRNALKHEPLLSAESRDFIQAYLDGVNEYIKSHKDEHHIEFKLAGIEPDPWKVADSLAVFYYMGWGNSANINTEITAQMLIEKVGPEKARELWPININPDDEDREMSRGPNQTEGHLFTGINFEGDETLMSFLDHAPDVDLTMGSNNWIQGPAKSETGKVIFTNDPHLDSRILPGPWHPVGLIAPGYRGVGVSIPGIPGIVIGRNQHVAFGITNSYGDVQDLYIESIDPDNPDNYLEGNRSIPFTKITETLKVRDKNSEGGFREETVTVELTRRGPVISGVMKGFDTEKVVSLRFAPFENMSPDISINEILVAQSVNDLRKALSKLTFVMANFVCGDTEGNICLQTTGKLPVRSQGESITPFPVKDGRDNWVGWIPFGEMPHKINPPRGWIGTCNHKTIPEDYPRYISSYFSHSYRYRRLKELMSSKEKISVEDNWQFMRDIKNMMAMKTAPVIAEILLSNDETKKLGEILRDWNFFDRKDGAAPLVYQALYHRFAELTVADELGKKLAVNYLDNRYFWKERFQKMVLEGDSPWFDDVTTEEKETMKDILLKAAADVIDTYGRNPSSKEWGDFHRLEFVSPIMRSGPLKGLLGGGSHPMAGSDETLYRASYKYSKPYETYSSASLRMVVDFTDNDRVLAVLPCGVVGRQFHKHFHDQTKSYMNGEKLYWWFSDTMIYTHGKHTLTLKPAR